MWIYLSQDGDSEVDDYASGSLYVPLADCSEALVFNYATPVYGMPKQGTVELAIFEIDVSFGEPGITFSQLQAILDVDADALSQSIQNLHTGMYPSEQDKDRRFDA